MNVLGQRGIRLKKKKVKASEDSDEVRSSAKSLKSFTSANG